MGSKSYSTVKQYNDQDQRVDYSTIDADGESQITLLKDLTNTNISLTQSDYGAIKGSLELAAQAISANERSNSDALDIANKINQGSAALAQTASTAEAENIMLTLTQYAPLILVAIAVITFAAKFSKGQK